MKWVKVLLAVVGGLVVLAALGIGGGLWYAHEPMPDAVPGPQAEAMARSMVAAVDGEAWQQTGAVAWTFGGRNAHLWDRVRELDRVTTGDQVVWIDLKTQRGRAERAGVPLEGADLDAALAAAWAAWCNDAFWLNPVVKAFDPGTSRGLVTLPEGRQGVMVSYSSGGVTPGDSYLWLLDDQQRPEAWKMWVSIIPWGGADTTWEGWTELPTGAWVATRHHSGELGITLEITDLRAAATLAELEPNDPFAALVAK